MLIFKEVELVLSGQKAIDTVSEAAQHLCLVPIHKAAIYVLAAPTSDTRRERLAKVPSTIRGAVEAEANRLWRLRRKAS